MGIFKKKDLLTSLSKRKEELLDALGEEVLILDTAYKIVYANQKFLENRGKSIAEVIGRYCYQVTHNLDKPCHMSDQVCPLNEVVKGNPPLGVIHQYKGKEEEKIVEITASPLKDKKGGLKGIIELFRDISEREKEKRESEEKYGNLIEKSNDAIAIVQDDQIKLFNQKLVELTGYSREELQEADFREGIAPECRELIIDRYTKRQRGEEVPDHYQFTLLTKNGQRKDVEMRVTLIEYQGKIASYCFLKDISEKKNAEEELKKVKDYLDNIINTSQVAITVIDNQGNFSIFNQGAERLTGYKAEEVIGRKRIFDFYADEKELEHIQGKLQESGLIENFETSLLRKDGSRAPISISVSLLKDQEGNPIGSIGISSDISERKQAEQEVLRQNAVLKVINKVLQETLACETDEEVARKCLALAEELTGSKFGFIGELNQAGRFDTIALSDPGFDACRMPKSEAVVMIKDMEIRAIWGRALKDSKSLIVNDPLSHPDRVGTPEGHPPITSFLGVPLKRAGRYFGMIGLANKKLGYDLADQEAIEALSVAFVEALYRKRAEKALRESEERLNAIIENTPNVAIEGYDINGNIIYWNKAAERLFGWTQKEALGKTIDQLILDKESAEEFHKILKNLDGLNKPSEPSEWKCRNKNGNEITVYSTVFPIPSSGGKKEFICMDIDITQRKKAEEEIKYLQEFNQEIVEKLPLGVLRLNREGKIVYENPKMSQIMGVEKGGKSRAIGMKITQMPNVVGSGVVQQMETLLAGTPFAYQVFPFVSLYGKKTILSVNGVPLFNPQGNPEGAILLIEDVTESKKIEQKIIQANKELSALNAISSITNQSLNLDLILNETLDKVLELTDCQAGGIYILNQTDKVLELKSCKGLSPEAIREVDRLKLGEGFSGRIALTGEPITVEDISQDPRLTRMVMKREGLHSYLGVTLKSKGKILGTLFVITQQDRRYNSDEIQLLASIGNQIGMAVENAHLFREAEQWIVQLEAIRNITNRLNKLNDVKTVASAVMDEIKKVIEFDNCRVFLLNDSREELIPIAFGSEVEEYKDETEEVLRLKVGEGITGWVAQTGEGQVIDDGERHPRCRHIPGTPYVDESIMASPMIYEGVVRGVITLSKLGLKQFNQNHLTLLSILANEAVVAIENAKLFEGLKQAYARLKEAQEKLVQSEKLRALGEMAGGVAHDFNNLLGAILGRAQLLLLSAKEQDTRKGLKVIEKAALDGAETVRRIQEFTRLRTDENFILLDINEILKESLEITMHKWKDEAQKKGILIQVETDLDRNLPLIAGNPSELREVFVNMILNSIDAMSNGGTLFVSSRSNESHVLASVSDTGIGMSEEIQRKVFDPFFTTKGPKGNGLGMSLAYGIVIRHNSEISIESQEGKGTTFSVKLPLRKIVDKKGGKQEKPEEGATENILIIDDEPAIRELLCDILQSRGYKAVVVDDSLRGVELFEKEQFDIVFTDLSMPEMSGWEVADRLKSLNPDVVIVMVTGWGTQVDSRRLKAHAVDLLMAKPFEVKKLFEILNDAQKIKKKREEKKLEKVTSG
ncbi:MAG: PAS domain S-box protein [candidate division Zixibacteria bacterium]|nr:PAS domain S-box protein [candidate division Zixibacteria bacterium]